MKRLMLLLAFLISIGTSAFGQLVKEVTLSSETNLAAALGVEAAKVTTLKITGPLTTEDFATMKDDMAMLQVLDMSGVTSLPEGSSLENGQNVFYQYIPTSALQDKLTLEKVIMPACLEIVSSAAFCGCSNLFEVDFSLSSALKYIKTSAFSSCTKLLTLDLSENQFSEQNLSTESVYGDNSVK